MGLVSALQRIIRAIVFPPFPATAEAADCDECGRSVAPREGVRDEARRKVWCSESCAEVGLERFAI